MTPRRRFDRARSKWLCESMDEVVQEYYLMSYISEDGRGNVNSTRTRGAFLRAAFLAFDWNGAIAHDLAAVQP